MKRILNLSGKALSGKDTTANILCKYLNGKSLIIHHADSLKFYAQKYAGWDGKKDDVGRKILQLLGTDNTKVKLNKPFFWVEKTCDIAEIFQDDFDYFLVPDCRFIAELCYPQARFPNKVTSIRIERPNFDNGLTEEQKNHISETELDNYNHDVVFYNEGNGLEKYEDKIKNMYMILLNNCKLL